MDTRASVPATPEPARSATPTAADDADAAWLAGVAVYEPPAEDEPEPPFEDSEPEQPVAARAVPSQPVATVARPGAPRRESPVEAVQRHALQARTQAAAASSAPVTAPAQASSAASPDPYDDAASDDPEIATTGLVGVPLVVKLLDGTVIDEQIDQI